MALFSITTISKVGNRNNTLFWTDRFLHGCSIDELAPTVVASVQPCLKNKRTVAQALENNTWMNGIQGGLTMFGFMEFFRLFDCLCEVGLSEEEDQHVSNLMLQEFTQLKSGYRAYFIVSVTFEP